jgi:hypothetical protein
MKRKVVHQRPKRVVVVPRLKNTRHFISAWGVAGGFSLVLALFLIFSAWYSVPLVVDGLGIILFKSGIGQLTSPINATVEKWFLEEGDAFLRGDALVNLKSHVPPFLNNEIKAAEPAIIAEIIAYPGSRVEAGDALALLTANGDKRSDLELTGFVSSLEGKKIAPGMPVFISPTIIDEYSHGTLRGVVKRVAKLPASKASLNSLVKIPELAKYIRNQIEAEPFLVVISLVSDEKHLTGYMWIGPGPRFQLDSGLIANFQVIHEEKSLLKISWPWLHRMLFGDR